MTPTQITYTYDDVGNITYKSDHASGYLYGGVNNDCNAGNENLGPNQLRQATVNLLGPVTYCYDHAGNMTDQRNGGQWIASMDYDADNLTTYVSKGAGRQVRVVHHSFCKFGCASASAPSVRH